MTSTRMYVDIHWRSRMSTAAPAILRPSCRLSAVSAAPSWRHSPRRLPCSRRMPVEAPRMPGEAFARLYKLTGAELRVLLALAQGLGAMEAADMLGIGEP